MFIKNRILPENRRKRLKQILEHGNVRAIEVHSGISGLIAEESRFKENGIEKEFNALWISSLTDSVTKGYPDEEIVSMDSRISTVDQIVNITSKPIIYDGDTGGFLEQLNYLIKRLEIFGVSAVTIEDKQYPKTNSLLENGKHALEEKEKFSEKIRYAIRSRSSDDFMIIARIESLICGENQDKALERAISYLEAKADGIMIHSKSSSPSEVLTFASKYNKLDFPYGRKPLMCVPTTYNKVKEKDLIEAGFNIILYANHQLRASYLAMKKVCYDILSHDSSSYALTHCCTLKEILEIVGSVRTYESEYREKEDI